MKLLKSQVLYGPNYWSNFRNKLIVLDIDLEQFEACPSHLIPEFNAKLKNLLPSLFNHYCSELREGGFFTRLEEGTWLGHVIEHVALELQWLAGMECGFGRTRSAKIPGQYHVIFSYEYEEAGLFAGLAAFDLVNTLAKGENYTLLDENISRLKKIAVRFKLGPSAHAIVKELDKRNIPYQKLDDDSLLIAGQGQNQKLVLSTETSFTSVVSAEIAANKVLTKKLLSQHYIPVPKGIIIKDQRELELALDVLNLPLVVKPTSGNHGRGVSINIFNESALQQAFHFAKQFGDEIIIEEFVQGKDYRFLVVDYKVAAAAQREPAKICGDGKSTISELIQTINSHPLRGLGHDDLLTQIEIDESTLTILKENNFTLNSILSRGQELYVKHVANLSKGGTAEDVTDIVHSYNNLLAERVARLVHLDICGIDIIAKDIRKPISAENGAVIEVNSSPGLRMHLSPTRGKSRNVAKPIVDMLFPNASSVRIPITAVTGTNGKTTVVRLLAYLAKEMGYSIGFTTTDGIYINEFQIEAGDCSGPLSAKTVLSDPAVNFAILECARGGILRSGLGFDHCNVSIVTNVSEDHLGIDGISTLEELRDVKIVLPKSTFTTGYAILNADDDLVYSMQDELDCKIALFALTRTKRILDHINQGGLAAYLDSQHLVIEDSKEQFDFGNINEMPLTLAGSATAMIKNILPVVLAAYINKFNLDTMKKVLKTLELTSQLLPGRMNIFEVYDKTILLDYAHNSDAFLELKKYMDTIKVPKKIGIIAATGDRRESDIIRIGKYAAEIFDEIIIRHDKDGRGRTNDELTELLMQGINAADKPVTTTIISDEFEAISFALKNTVPHAFIFYFPDDIAIALNYLKILVQPSTSERVS